MIAKLRRPSAAWWCRGRRRRTRPGQCLPREAATLLPQSSLPGQRRRRRNSLVVVTKHPNMSTKKSDNVCLASTGDKAYPKPSVAVHQLDDVVDDAALQRHNPSLVVEQLDGVAALQRPSSSTASSLGNLMVSWMSFAASVPTCDGPVTLIGTQKKNARVARKTQ